MQTQNQTTPPVTEKKVREILKMLSTNMKLSVPLNFEYTVRETRDGRKYVVLSFEKVSRRQIYTLTKTLAEKLDLPAVVIERRSIAIYHKPSKKVKFSFFPKRVQVSGRTYDVRDVLKKYGFRYFLGNVWERNSKTYGEQLVFLKEKLPQLVEELQKRGYEVEWLDGKLKSTIKLVEEKAHH